MKKKHTLIWIIILIAIAALLLFLGGTRGGGAGAGNLGDEVKVSITENDHYLGNPQAQIAIIEYSDLECPSCKEFHNVMTQIMGEYGQRDQGQVAWIYRHFPIDQIHPKARREAEAAECAAELGGEEAFWGYINRIFEETPSNNRLDLAKLPDFAEDLGLDRQAFETCYDERQTRDKVQADYQSGRDLDVPGTPYSIVLFADGTAEQIFGVRSLPEMRKMINDYLNSQEAEATATSTIDIEPAQ